MHHPRSWSSKCSKSWILPSAALYCVMSAVMLSCSSVLCTTACFCRNDSVQDAARSAAVSAEPVAGQAGQATITCSCGGIDGTSTKFDVLGRARSLSEQGRSRKKQGAGRREGPGEISTARLRTNLRGAPLPPGRDWHRLRLAEPLGHQQGSSASPRAASILPAPRRNDGCDVFVGRTVDFLQSRGRSRI